MKKCCLFLVFCLPFLAWAEVHSVQSLPNPKHASVNNYVSDPDNIINAADKSEINSLLRQLEDSTTVQVGVAVVNSIGDLVPKEFATELFRFWGIGHAENNNGLLILFVIDQRRMEFEVGYGLEGILTDGISKRIQVERMVPRAKEADYGGAIVAGVKEVNRILMDPKYQEEIVATTDAFGNDSRSVWRKPTGLGLLLGVGIPWLLIQLVGWRTEGKNIKKAPAYVQQHFNASTSAARRFFLSLGVPAALVSSQYMTGILRVGEFLLILYAVFAFVSLIKRFRLNTWIQQYAQKKNAYEEYQLMQKSHQKGWLMTAIFAPFPMLFYWFWYKRNQHTLRNTPPLNEAGHQYRKLDEKMDDGFLKAYQITEEKIKSIDYDVWLDPDSNEPLIYRYDLGKSAYTTCSNCGGKTKKHTKTRTISAATTSSTGTGEKTYTCKHCGHITSTTFTIPMVTTSSSGSGGSGGGGGGGGSFGGGSSGGGGAGSSW